MSERNKENRAKQDMGHIAGTKSFARIGYDSRDPETGEEPNCMELWLTTKFSMKRNAWVGRRSGEVYNDLKRQEAQSMEEGATPMTEDQRFEAVLCPEKSGYIRGRGVGPKPTTSTAGQRIRAQLEKENEELKRQAETNRMHWESLEKENSDLAS